jgi:hypothetical protein
MLQSKSSSSADISSENFLEDVLNNINLISNENWELIF